MIPNHDGVGCVRGRRREPPVTLLDSLRAERAKHFPPRDAPEPCPIDACVKCWAPGFVPCVNSRALDVAIVLEEARAEVTREDAGKYVLGMAPRHMLVCAGKAASNAWEARG